MPRANAIEARHGLQNYWFTMRTILQEEKLVGGDKEKIENAAQDALDWLDNNKLAEKKDIEAKQQKLEAIVKPIMLKVHEAAARADEEAEAEFRAWEKRVFGEDAEEEEAEEEEAEESEEEEAAEPEEEDEPWGPVQPVVPPPPHVLAAYGKSSGTGGGGKRGSPYGGKGGTGKK